MYNIYMPFKIIREDITKVKVECIVNSANPKPTYGGGCDYAIYEAAGKEKLLKERIKIGNMNISDVAITPAFHLPSKYIIHVVAPKFIDGKHNEKENLIASYKNVLNLAKDKNITNIAIPLLSSGSYGYPKEEAMQIALECIQSFLLLNDMNIYLTVFDATSFSISNKLFDDIESYIDEHYVDQQIEHEYYFSSRVSSRRALRSIRVNNCDAILEEAIAKPTFDFDDTTFQDKLFEYIDAKEMGDVEVYKKANIDRKLFSKIRCKKDYHPKKETVLALCIALELNIDETKDLLSRAGHALSPCSKFDVIIQYFIEHEVYNIITINEILFEYNEPTLGC